MLKKNLPILLLSLLILESAYFIYFKNKKEKEISEMEEYIDFTIGIDDISTNGKIYFIGNSIFSNGDWNELLGKSNIENKAIPGITTMDAVMMIEKLLPDRPDEVYVLLGVNDIKVMAPWDVAFMNYNQFLYSLKCFTPRTKVNVISVLPANYSDFETYEIDNSEINLLNESLKDLCLKYRYNYIDCHDDFMNDNGELLKELSSDGLHLTPLGYEKLANAIKTAN